MTREKRAGWHDASDSASDRTMRALCPFARPDHGCLKRSQCRFAFCTASNMRATYVASDEEEGVKVGSLTA